MQRYSTRIRALTQLGARRTTNAAKDRAHYGHYGPGWLLSGGVAVGGGLPGPRNRAPCRLGRSAAAIVADQASIGQSHAAWSFTRKLSQPVSDDDTGAA